MDSIKILKEEMDKQAGVGSVLKTGLKYMYSPFGNKEEIIRKAITKATIGRKLVGGGQKNLETLLYNAVVKKEPKAIAEIARNKALLSKPKLLESVTGIGRKKRVTALRQLRNEVSGAKKGSESADSRSAANVLYRLGILGGATGGATFGIGKAVDYSRKKKAKKLENLISNIQ